MFGLVLFGLHSFMTFDIGYRKWTFLETYNSGFTSSYQAKPVRSRAGSEYEI